MTPSTSTQAMLVAAVLTLAAVPAADADEVKVSNAPAPSRSSYESVPAVAGPSSVGAELKEDERARAAGPRFELLDRRLEPYFDFKGRINERYGLAFGFDYTALYQVATGGPGEDQAAGGIARAFGSWSLIGRESGNTGSIVFKGENRHRLGTDVAPQSLGFEVGYVGLTAQPFNDFDWALTNLYWQQQLLGGRVALLAGQVDATDYVDVHALTNPWTQFSNLAFGISPTISAPNQGFGAMAGVIPAEHFYAIIGFADANGDPTDPGEGFDTFFDDAEYFKHLELGWTSSYDRRYLDNVHVTAWHVDERHDAGTPSDWGVAASATWFFADVWMPFLRGGYSDEGTALMEGSVSAGLARYFSQNRDLMALGLGWGRPPTQGLDDQYAVELFYRWQLSANVAITPDVQLLVNPALAPSEDVVGVFGIRARLAL